MEVTRIQQGGVQLILQSTEVTQIRVQKHGRPVVIPLMGVIRIQPHTKILLPPSTGVTRIQPVGIRSVRQSMVPIRIQQDGDQ